MSQLSLNPLTAGIATGEDGAVLRLRSFAKARSFGSVDVDRAGQPELYQDLSDWIDGGPEPDMSALTTPAKTAMLRGGLLIFNEERAAVPDAARPVWGDGEQLARALVPRAAELFAPVAPPPVPEGAADDLARDGYCHLPGLLDPAHLAAVRAFYRELYGGGWARFLPEEGRALICNGPVARHLYHGLTPIVAEITGEALKPSYSLACEYRDGAELKRHTDREQCELTLSLFIDYDPQEPDRLCPWPLVIHAPGGDVAAPQPPGGGPLFYGRRLPHSRPPLAPGHRARMVFLHWVRESFDGSLD